MLVLTNCLTQTPDEGALKVANSIIKRIKQEDTSVKVISFERESPLSDRHLKLNKMMINMELIHSLRETRDPVLYLPFPAPMLPTAMRIFIISCFARHRLKALLVMKGQICTLAKMFLRWSKAELYALSHDNWCNLHGIVGEKARYLKVGVDTEKFKPVTAEHKQQLREKYDLSPDKIIILHVGHMKEGRNIAKVLELDARYLILIVISTLTLNEQDVDLRRRLESHENVQIVDEFIPDIEEIYQASDVYFFPVVEKGNCIDIPLSAFEAAACNIPVVHTPYGELAEMCGRKGFYEITSFDHHELNELTNKAIAEKQEPRENVLEYDWGQAIQKLCTR